MRRRTSATLANTWKSIDRWRWIVRYHRPSQLARRFYRNLWALGRATWPVNGGAEDISDVERAGPLSESCTDDLAHGRISLLNRVRDLGRPIDWSLRSWPQAPLLWAFHLHYHEFLNRAVLAENSPRTWQTVWEILADWLDGAGTARPPGRIAWHPYCISRRLVAWIRLLHSAAPPAPLEARLYRSMANQAAYLASHLEQDIGGNHLWDNARALAALGASSPTSIAEQWRRLGICLLDRCLREQLLPHGEHFERSPMYQVDLAAGLGELANWLEPLEPETSERYRDTAARMTAFVDRLRHPDGGIPLFGDATLDFDAPRPPADDFSGRMGDYFIDRSADACLVFDAGPLGPDHLPAHAHADLLGFEMSLAGQRLLVDSGVFSYSGPARQRYRSSAAHNVLIIDNVELADVWGDFRMGRRGHVLERAAGTVAEGRWFRASHDAYRHLGAPRVTRVFFCGAAAAGPYFSIHVVLGPGGREHRFAESLHFSPATAVELSGRMATLGHAGRRIVWEAATEPSIISAGPAGYAPRFYREVAITALEVRQTESLPALCAWALSPTGERLAPVARLEGQRIVLSWTWSGSRRSAVIPWN